MLRKITATAIFIGVAFAAHSNSSGNKDDNAPLPLMIKEGRDFEIRDLATYQLKRRFSPMTEGGAVSLKRELEERERVINTSVREPDQQNRTISINPAISNDKPTIYSSANFLTTIVLVDKYGNPWNIKDIGVGAASFFEVKLINPYTLWLYPKKKYSKSNISILLEGLVTPVTFDLLESSDKVDYSIQAKVLKAGVNTNINDYEYSPLQAEITKNNITSDLSVSSMVDGITPRDAFRLRVTMSGEEINDIQAWEYNDSYFVRLRGAVVSPQPMPAGHPNIDGFQLFKIPRISSLLIERDGVLISGVMLEK